MKPTALLAVLAVTPGAWAQSELVLPEPSAPAPRVIEEQGPGPTYYRLPPRVVLPLLRLGMGLQVRPGGEAREAGAAFTFDAHAGAVVRLGRGARTGVLTEVGYSYVGFSEHLASLGLGLMHGLSRARGAEQDSWPGGPRLALVPHALVGRAYGEPALGVRTSLVAGWSFYSVELAHQALWVGPGPVHEFRLMLTSLAPWGEDE